MRPQSGKIQSSASQALARIRERVGYRRPIYATEALTPSMTERMALDDIISILDDFDRRQEGARLHWESPITVTREFLEMGMPSDWHRFMVGETTGLFRRMLLDPNASMVDFGIEIRAYPKMTDWRQEAIQIEIDLSAEDVGGGANPFAQPVRPEQQGELGILRKQVER